MSIEEQVNDEISQNTDDNEKAPLPPLVPFDASATIEIDKNKMIAFVTLKSAENGGIPISRELIMKALSEAKVTFGIIQSEIDRLVVQPEYNTRIEIAKGIEPINGIDGSIEYTFDPNITMRPKERGDGTVDYYNLDILNNVKRGDLLATIHPDVKAIDGKNVMGEIVKGINGKPVVPPFGKNVTFSEDKTQIFANADGNVEVRQNQISVNEVFKVSDVDIATGNIDFVGNVHVNGNVLAGFTVKAGQDLIVKGMIESTSVEAGRNMVINGGILGTPQNIITCNGDLNCKFIENVTVKVKGNIKAEYITNANVICEGTLELIGSKACIIGGNIVVLKKIIANSVGSPYGAITNIQLGSYGTIQEKKKALDQKAAEILATESKLAQIISYLTSIKKANGSLDEDKDEMLKSAIRSKTILLVEKSTVNKELAKLAGEMNFLGKQNLEVKGILYRGTIVNIKNTVFEADKDYQHTNFYFDEDKQEIVFGTL